MAEAERFTLLCPVCREPLSREENAYLCSNSHSFDISRRGYVNLLLGNSRGHHGDDKRMVRARTDFLNKGYYDRLSDEICSIVMEQTEPPVKLIDAGCGEGKYLADILKTMKENGKDISALAADISKDAVSALTARTKEAQAIVASTAALPVPSASADMLLNVFAPFFPEEFCRVLRTGGTVLRVVPLEKHLMELKAIVYDSIYLNDVPDYEEPGFTVAEKREIRYPITLNCNEDIRNLFLMTPYYYKTSAEDQKKLENAQQLQVSLEFLLILYRKL